MEEEDRDLTSDEIMDAEKHFRKSNYEIITKNAESVSVDSMDLRGLLLLSKHVAVALNDKTLRRDKRTRLTQARKRIETAIISVSGGLSDAPTTTYRDYKIVPLEADFEQQAVGTWTALGDLKYKEETSDIEEEEKGDEDKIECEEKTEKNTDPMRPKTTTPKKPSGVVTKKKRNPYSKFTVGPDKPPTDFEYMGLPEWSSYQQCMNYYEGLKALCNIQTNYDHTTLETCLTSVPTCNTELQRIIQLGDEQKKQKSAIVNGYISFTLKKLNPVLIGMWLLNGKLWDASNTFFSSSLKAKEVIKLAKNSKEKSDTSVEELTSYIEACKSYRKELDQYFESASAIFQVNESVVPKEVGVTQGVLSKLDLMLLNMIRKRNERLGGNKSYSGDPSHYMDFVDLLTCGTHHGTTDPNARRAVGQGVMVVREVKMTPGVTTGVFNYEPADAVKENIVVVLTSKGRKHFEFIPYPKDDADTKDEHGASTSQAASGISAKSDSEGKKKQKKGLLLATTAAYYHRQKIGNMSWVPPIMEYEDPVLQQVRIELAAIDEGRIKIQSATEAGEDQQETAAASRTSTDSRLAKKSPVYQQQIANVDIIFNFFLWMYVIEAEKKDSVPINCFLYNLGQRIQGRDKVIEAIKVSQSKISNIVNYLNQTGSMYTPPYAITPKRMYDMVAVFGILSARDWRTGFTSPSCSSRFINHLKTEDTLAMTFLTNFWTLESQGNEAGILESEHMFHQLLLSKKSAYENTQNVQGNVFGIKFKLLEKKP